MKTTSRLKYAGLALALVLALGYSAYCYLDSGYPPGDELAKNGVTSKAPSSSGTVLNF